MLAVFLAEGFEEIEALTPVDILRRAGVDVVTIGIGSQTVTGAHGIAVRADRSETDWREEELEGVILPAPAIWTNRPRSSARWTIPSTTSC